MSVQGNPFGQMWRGTLPSAPPDKPESKLSNEWPYLQGSNEWPHLQGVAPDQGTATLKLFAITSSLSQQLLPFYGLTEMPSFMFMGIATSLGLGSFTDVISEIENLAAENEVPPTNFAYLHSRAVVGAAYGLMLPKQSLIMPMSHIPRPVVVTDDVGGIRLAWRKGIKTVRANFGANDNLRSYVYFESGIEHGVRPLDAASLSDMLNWLIKR
jgi:hypothetical protein